MTISRLAITLYLLSYLYLFALFSPSSCSAYASEIETEKVSLDLYYESLCPYSANFIINYLDKLFKDDLISIVDLKLYPWGNAKMKNGTVACQHGPYECLLNTVEACAINIWPELNVHFPFIYCVEELVYQRKYSQWKTCFEKLTLDSKPVLDCYSSEFGKELELLYGAKTYALKPPHQYVPWVVVDGQPLYEDYENFLIYVCKAYKGSSIPKICSEPSHNPIKIRRANPGVSVCYKDEATKSSFSATIRSVVASLMQQMNMESLF